MSFLPLKPEEFKAGAETLSAGDLNRILRAAPRQVRGGSDIAVEDYGDRVRVSSRVPKIILPDHRYYSDRFIFCEEYDDYLLCVPDDGRYPLSTLIRESPIYIAKPPMLRRSAYDGRSHVSVEYDPVALVDYTYYSKRRRWVSRSDIGDILGDLGHEEVIRPTYVIPSEGVREFVYAIKTATGLQTDEDEPQDIIWQDINVAGRRWERVCPQEYALVTKWTGATSSDDDGAFKLINGSIRAYSATLSNLKKDTGELVAYNIDKFYDVWLVPLNPLDHCAVGKTYACWRGQSVDGHQLYYTAGDKRDFYLRWDGGSGTAMRLNLGTLPASWEVDPTFIGAFPMTSSTGGSLILGGIYRSTVVRNTLQGGSIYATYFVAEPTAQVVTVPAHNTSPGLAGQIAFDGNWMYICKGTNDWARFSLGFVTPW